MRIPTYRNYVISRDGVVTSLLTDEIVPEKRGRGNLRSVRLVGSTFKPKWEPLARLLLRTFDPLPDTEDHRWVSVGYRDGDQDNLSLDNLYWDRTWYEPELPLKHGVLYPVPGYQDISIRYNDGWEVFEGDKPAVFKLRNEGNYLNYQTRQNKSLALHRAVALTFIRHPLDTYQIIPNHKDSNKLNNELDNLEWTTYSENNQHSYASGGGKDHLPKKVLIKCMVTGDIQTLDSINEAARHFNTNPGVIYGVLHHRDRRCDGFEGYLVKYEDEPITWEELAIHNGSNRAKKVAAKDISTGEVRVYGNYLKLAEGEKINAYNLKRLFGLPYCIPWRGLYIKIFEGDPNDIAWPAFPPEIEDAYSRLKSGGRPIIVRNEEDGSIEYSSGIIEWCEADRANRCDQAVLSRVLKKRNHWRNWTFAFVDPHLYQ